MEYLETAREPPETDDSPPIQKSEVEAAVKSLKLGKAPGVDNIPSELLKAGGEEVKNILTALCQRIWNEKKWPTEWTKSLVVPLPKKGNLRLCNNYRTISLISHPSKVMLRVILNRLKPKAGEILAEEQAGFRAGRSTVEQIFNCRILIEMHMQHQRDMFHNFIDFKEAFDRWKASADEDDKRRLGVITSRNGPEWQCTNWSGQPQTEMHGDRKLLLLPSDPPDDPTGRGTEMR
ncbi:endonuclease-reverse transcriptase [Elysia marginata]|uniref:Endonuclease-reverse transcriptase n=1 Tax=Elysia marginata TaxID=1093978 RepID=A0AAV4J456_9GAST|nr:endonuclease-reverse transcriptase [Elysia marginata]